MTMKYKKIYCVLFFLFIIGVVIYYTTPYQYLFAKLLSVVRSGGEFSRTAYGGYVKIDSTTLEDVVDTLQKNRCKAISPVVTEDTRCYYRRILLQNTEDSLIVYPNGMGWGPISFTITSEKLFFSKDILGKPDIEKLKVDVRKDASFADVKIRENSWKIESVRYPWDVIY